MWKRGAPIVWDESAVVSRPVPVEYCHMRPDGTSAAKRAPREPSSIAKGIHFNSTRALSLPVACIWHLLPPCMSIDGPPDPTSDPAGNYTVLSRILARTLGCAGIY